MSQTYNLPVSVSDVGRTAITDISDGMDALLTNFLGTSAPSSPSNGQLWYDSTNSALKLRVGGAWVTILEDVTVAGGGLVVASAGAFDTAAPTSAVGATTSTHLVRKGEVDAMTQVASITIPGFDGAVNINLAVMPACTITAAYIVSDTATSSDGSNSYDLSIYNATEAESLAAAAENTNTDGDLVANTAYSLTIDQNATLAAGELLQMRVTETGTATDLTSADIRLVLQYTVAV